MKVKDTSIKLESQDGTKVFATLEEAVAETGLTKRQLELRATNNSEVKGIKYSWLNPSTRRSYIGRRSRKKGNAFELEVIKMLQEIGYIGCVSSRSESKTKDDNKVDIVDTEDKLPCYIQVKNTSVFPNYHRIKEACPYKDKPFTIVHKTNGKEPTVTMTVSFFLSLIKQK